MSIDLKQSQKQLADNLFVILNSQKIGYSEIRKPNFQEIIENQFNILYFLEKKNKAKHTKSLQLVERYNALLNKNFKINESLNYDDLDNLTDDLNYLSVYYKNILKIDLNEFTNTYKDKIVETNKNVQTPSIKTDVPKQSVPNAEKISSDQQTVINNNNNNIPPQQGPNPWSGMKSGMMGGMNNPYMMGNMPGVDPHQNPYLIGMAQARISTEIKQGKIFAYKSKPKIICVAKIVTAALIALLGCACLILCIFMGMSDGFSQASWIIEAGKQPPHYSCVSYCIMYALFFVIFEFAAYWLIKPMIVMTDRVTKQKKMPNQNELYYFAWQIIAIFALFFVISLVMGMFLNQELIFTSIPIYVTDKVYVNPTQVTGLWGWYYTYIALFAIAGLIIPPIVIGSIYNPKKDIEKINLIMNQYIDELASKQKPF